MTTPNAGEVIAVPELSRPICVVKSTLRKKSGQASPFAGRIATPFTTAGMYRGTVRDGEPPWVAVFPDEAHAQQTTTRRGPS